MLDNILYFSRWLSGRIRCPKCNCRLGMLPPQFADGLCLPCFRALVDQEDNFVGKVER